jgi:hypothetical protein
MRRKRRRVSPSVDVATFTPGAFVADVALVGNTGSFTPQAPGQTELFDLTCSGASAAGSVIDASTPGIIDADWQHTNANRFAQSDRRVRAGSARGADDHDDAAARRADRNRRRIDQDRV